MASECAVGAGSGALTVKRKLKDIIGTVIKWESAKRRRTKADTVVSTARQRAALTIADVAALEDVMPAIRDIVSESYPSRVQMEGLLVRKRANVEKLATRVRAAEQKAAEVTKEVMELWTRIGWRGTTLDDDDLDALPSSYKTITKEATLEYAFPEPAEDWRTDQDPAVAAPVGGMTTASITNDAQ